MLACRVCFRFESSVQPREPQILGPLFHLRAPQWSMGNQFNTDCSSSLGKINFWPKNAAFSCTWRCAGSMNLLSKIPGIRSWLPISVSESFCVGFSCRIAAKSSLSFIVLCSGVLWFLDRIVSACFYLAFSIGCSSPAFVDLPVRAVW